MKNFVLSIIFLLVFLLCTDLNAKKVYTWTDKKGNVHITDEPPPEGAKIESVLEDQPHPENQVRETEQRRGKKQKDDLREKRLQEAQEARAKAEKARKEAKKIEAEAAETIRQSQEYIDTHNRNQYMRRAHKYKLRKAQADIQAAQERARLAAEKARKAEEEARFAEERLKTLEGEKEQ